MRAAVRRQLALPAQKRLFTEGYFDKAETSGYYGRNSAPPGWDTSKAGKYDTELQALRAKPVLKKEHGQDASPRLDPSLAGVRTFKVKLTKKTQQEIDEEGKIEAADRLTDSQRENMRRRRKKREFGEWLGTSLRMSLRLVNKGRSNIGFLNKGDNNIGVLNWGDNNAGLLNFGDYNKGALLKGNDNQGFLCLGAGNVGALVYGSHNRGIDVWGDKLSGVCQTSDQFMKARYRLAICVILLLVACLPTWYNRVQRKRREKWLAAMDIEVNDENLAVMMKRKNF